MSRPGLLREKNKGMNSKTHDKLVTIVRWKNNDGSFLYTLPELERLIQLHFESFLKQKNMPRKGKGKAEYRSWRWNSPVFY